MRTIYRLMLILTSISLLAHCATTEPYPEDWSSPVAIGAGECADISGTFSNECTSATGRDSNCLESGGLAGLLLAKYAGSFHTKLGSADRVDVFQSSSSQLLVEAWKNEELVGEQTIHLDPEDCTADGVLIRTGVKGAQIEGGIGAGSSEAVLSKSEDGDLIARTRVKFTGVWFIVPVSGSSQDWVRFERLRDLEEEGAEVGPSPASAQR